MYEKAIVTFIDILGFGDLVLQSTFEQVKRALDAVEYHAAPKPDPNFSGYHEPETIVFSDSVVRVRKVETDDNRKYPSGLFFHELLDIVHAQGMLIDDGIVLRGGITYGDIFISGNRIYGPAMIDAYKLESEFAKYPRIVISPKLLQEFEDNSLLISFNTFDEDKEYVYHFLYQDTDYMWFIDYARAVYEELDDPESMYFYFLIRHKDLIILGTRKYKSNSSILVKYVWLTQYHNRVINGLSSKWLKRRNIKRENLLIRNKQLSALQNL